jgi:hypothetical protein
MGVDNIENTEAAFIASDGTYPRTAEIAAIFTRDLSTLQNLGLIVTYSERIVGLQP